jgi:hypothetical protein
VKLTPAAELGEAAEGIAHAPVFLWPRQKSFDDLPVIIGWSKQTKSYQAGYTNENGGTVVQCGGGAKGIQGEIARWGRAHDIEGVFSYGSGAKFGRCTGSGALAPNAPRMEGEHPRLYYGDGHNRLFESRGGYGGPCGGGGAEKANGSLEGWNTKNPGNDPANDDPFTIVLRPVPVDMDALGYAASSGRREGIIDTYAPWIYRLTDSELAREGKIDGNRSLPIQRYLFADVYAADVGGHGNSVCGSPLGVSGGFVLRAVSASGVESSSAQTTDDYFDGGSGVKRVAVPLAPGVTAKDIKKLVLDAYDDDGVFWLGVGDAFVAAPSGTNGATLDYVVKGKKDVNVYVDDGKDGCVDGKNTKDGVAYPCVGSRFELAL